MFLDDIRHIAAQLRPVYDEDEAKALARWIVDENALNRTDEIVDRLLQHEPIQYIFGRTYWNGLTLHVTPDTLIPRPETAELIEVIQQLKFPNSSDFSVLDIGTGSGCIALAIKQTHPTWKVKGIDIQPGTLEVARRNAEKNHLNVDFERCDILRDTPRGAYDLIVSNPPYIRQCEKADMRANVLDYEPHTALFVPDDDPLLFYRRIAELKLGRNLIFEINEHFGPDMVQMLESNGYFDIQIHRDIYGKDRIISCRIA